MNAMELAGIARIMARNFGVEVTVGGDTACCRLDSDPVTINIPYVAGDDPDKMARLRGYIDHETGHVRFTDRQVYIDTCRNDRYLGRLLNMFEDVYVEREMARVYPGCRRNLEWLQRSVFAREGDALTEKIDRLAAITQDDVRDVFDVADEYVLLRLRSHENAAIRPACSAVRDALERLMPGVAGRLDGVLYRAVDEGVSTADNLRLATEVRDILCRALTEPDDQQGQSGHGESQSGQGESQSGDGESQSGQGESRTGQDDDRSGQGSLLQMHRHAFERMAYNKGCEADAISQAVNDDAAESCGDAGMQGNGAVTMIDSLKRPGRLPSSEVAKARRATAAMSARLKALLQAKRMRYGQVSTTGQLDDRRLSSVMTGRFDVYRRRTPVVAENTDVILLMDYSGSMASYGKEDVARQSMYAVLTALRGVPGIRTAAYGFDGNQFVTVLKPGQMFAGDCVVTAGGGTYPGEALMRVVTKFTDPDRRRIIIVFTDGEAQSKRVFKDSVDSVLRSGYAEVYGIGIQSASIIAAFPCDRCDIVYNVDELPRALFGVLQRSMA